MRFTNSLESALHYHSEGLSVIPISENGKTPALPTWKNLQYKPMSAFQLQEFYSQNPNCNVGVVDGSISNNLFKLDCDISYGAKELERRIPHILNETRISISATKRLPHIWLYSPFPIKSGKNKEFGIDIKGEGGYTVEPISSIREKGQQLLYQFINYSSEIYTINSLEELDFLNLKIADPKTIRPYGLSPKVWELLRQEYSYKKFGYNSRSEADQAIITRLVTMSWTVIEIHDLFKKHSDRNSKFKEKEHKGISFDYISISFENARSYIQKNRSEIDKFIDQHFHFSNSYNWQETSGKNALRDKAIYETFLLICRMAGKIENIGISHRQLAIQAGYSTLSSINQALKSLQESNFIKKTKNNDLINATEYSLVEQCNPRTFQQDPQDVKECSIVALREIPDIFRHSGLGKTGNEVFEIIKKNPGISGERIAAISISSRRTVFYKLKTLITLGMVRNESNGYFVNFVNIENITKEIFPKLAGKKEKQRKFYSEQRELFRNKIKENGSSN